ncbi:hypothetical protein TNCV_3061561 [Trichonephila clavipes]|nr:hypothetical protein TNCV_3061561 [Trichonephila clavipes]
MQYYWVHSENVSVILKRCVEVFRNGAFAYLLMKKSIRFGKLVLSRHPETRTDSHEDKCLHESDCDESEESADEMENIQLNPDADNCHRIIVMFLPCWGVINRRDDISPEASPYLNPDDPVPIFPLNVPDDHVDPVPALSTTIPDDHDPEERDLSERDHSPDKRTIKTRYGLVVKQVNKQTI